MNHPEELPPRLHWFHHPKREGLERLHEINPATWSLISPFNHHHCHTTTVISRALLSAAAGAAIIGGSIITLLHPGRQQERTDGGKS
jgi:hypothetical protein